MNILEKRRNDMTNTWKILNSINRPNNYKKMFRKNVSGNETYTYPSHIPYITQVKGSHHVGRTVDETCKKKKKKKKEKKDNFNVSGFTFSNKKYR